jgi:hypothetical protein
MIMDESYLKKNGITIGIYLLIAAFVFVILGILFSSKVIGVGLTLGGAAMIVFIITSLLRVEY